MMPEILVARLQLPVPLARVIVQLPPAPLMATVPVGVPCEPVSVAVIVEALPTFTIAGDAVRDTVAPLVTLSRVVPDAALKLALPL